VIAVSVDEDPAAVRRYLDATPLPFPVVLDPQARVPELLGVDTMPQCFLIDRAGDIRLRHRGFHDGDDATLRAEILRLLDGGY
jgi:peroxiredoxin